MAHLSQAQARLSRATKVRGQNIEFRRSLEAAINFYIEDFPLKLNCECGQISCTETLEISYLDRLKARQDFQNGFIIFPSHLDEQNDTVLQNNLYCLIVLKKP